MIGSGYPEIKAASMTFFRGVALTGLALAAGPGAYGAETCDLELRGLSVQVARRDAELDIAVLEAGLLRTRLTLPADGPLRGCWVLDADADSSPEAIVATAVTEAGQPARLRAFHWTGERLDPVSLPALALDPAFSDAPREQLVTAAGTLFRTLKLGPRALHFRHNRESGTWVSVQDVDHTGGGNPADSLLQAPIAR